MTNYAIMTVSVPLPVAGDIKPGQHIPIAVTMPDNAIPLQVEYRPAAANFPASCAIHYLVPCDENGNPIEEEAIPQIYEFAWNELYKVFGERMQQEEIDLMDSVIKGIITEIQGNE